MGKGKLSEKNYMKYTMRFIFLINLLIRQSCPGGSVGQSGQGGWGDHDDRGGQG